MLDRPREGFADAPAVWSRFFPGLERPAHNGRAHYGAMVSGAEMVAALLEAVGADFIFGIPGGASLPLSDALTVAHAQGACRYVLTGHEQGAAFEATGYAAATGRVGFCTATSGPGATNLITGLADAFRDSRPVFAVTGNTATTAEPEAFQAIDIVGMTDRRATKASFRPERADQVQAVLVRAYHAAVTGRPGSVLVDLPKDVQVGKAQMQPWEDLIPTLDWRQPLADPADLTEIARLLGQAERPLVYAGHGVMLADAARELRELSWLADVPVVTTVHGIGLLPPDDPLNLGMLGMHGSMVANLAPYLADLVLVVGARFDDRVVGARPADFAPRARVVHVDVDAYQLNRVRRVDLAVQADVGGALRGIVAALADARIRPRAAWLRQLDAVRRAMPTQSYDDPATDELSHEYVYDQIARAARELELTDLIATFDVGTHQMKGAQWFPIGRPRSFITSGGMGSMGCSMPMAVGAALGRPDATVVASVGDGGFVMSSHELDTIGGYRLPVKIVLFDDAALGMVTNWHGLFFGGRALTSDRRRGRSAEVASLAELRRRVGSLLDRAESVEGAATALATVTAELARAEGHQYALTAAAYGIASERVNSRRELPAAVQRALAAPGPYLLHVVLPRQNQVYPLMEPGTSPQDMVWRETRPGSGETVRGRDRFDYEASRLR